MWETLRSRTISASIFGILMIGGILFSVKSAIILFGVVCLISAFEYTRIVRKNLRDAMFNTTFVAGIILYALAFSDFLDNYNIYILLTNCLFFLGFILSLILNRALFSSSQLSPVFALIYIGLPFYLLHAYFFTQSYQAWLLMAVFICIWLNDSGAYFIGSWLGKHKLFPRVSPNKTWEGTLGGLIIVQAGVYILHSLNIVQSFDYSDWIILGLLCSVFGTFGDLYESQIKRKYKLKDSGTIMPGHGGLLDRFDSFIFIIPFTALFLEFWPW